MSVMSITQFALLTSLSVFAAFPWSKTTAKIDSGWFLSRHNVKFKPPADMPVLSSQLTQSITHERNSLWCARHRLQMWLYAHMLITKKFCQSKMPANSKQSNIQIILFWNLKCKIWNFTFSEYRGFIIFIMFIY